MGKASIATAVRAAHVPLRVSCNASRKAPLGFGYLKLAILLTMIFLPWVGIIYVVRVALTGH
jgi:hypothetical protein